MECDTTNTDGLLKRLGGCGRFQVILASVAYLPQISFAFTMLLMSFGAYNPGWRCLDNNGTTTNITNGTGYVNTRDVDINSAGGYTDEMKCDDFKACQNVMFNPEASTIITEWRLVCDEGWVPLTMMSLQMVGVLIGTLLNGFLGDRFGRKKTLYSFLSVNIVLNFISIFSVSWQMYMTLRFLLGITCGVIGYTACIFITEFVPPKWRVRISSLPFWSIGAMLFGIVVMVTKDWKQIHIISTVVSTVCLLPVLWVPESLRWLLVQEKETQALEVVRKISHWNRTEVPDENSVKLQGKSNRSGLSDTVTILSLFRRNTLKFTLIFGSLFMSIDLMYYATSFGVSSLPGNLYTNFFILFATELPSNLISSTIPNVVGRRPVLMASYALQALFLFAVATISIYADGRTKTFGTLVLVVLARLCLAVEWYVILAYVAEVYPTVVRSTASGYGGLMAAFGSITAPYLIQSDTSKQHISYFVMAGFTTFCCLLLPLLPETKERPLSDTWERTYPEDVNENHTSEIEGMKKPRVQEA